MLKPRLIIFLFTFILCTSTNAQNWKSISVNDSGATLEYNASKVKQDDAHKLARYLLHIGYYDTGMFARIDKEDSEFGDTYIFSVLVAEGYEDNPFVHLIAQSWILGISMEVFKGASVVVHLCDKNMKIVKIIR